MFMKIEKINDNKIRIILNSIDLIEKNIDIHSFITNSAEAQDVFWDILEEADKEIGFKANDCKLIIEALAVNGGNFVLTVTKIQEESNEKLRRPKVIAKMRNTKLDKNRNIFSFSNFDNFLNLCLAIDPNNIDNVIKDVVLYEYKAAYYLSFKVISQDISKLKTIAAIFSEFGSYVKGSEVFFSKLTEYGKVIEKDNALIKLKNVYTHHS